VIEGHGDVNTWEGFCDYVQFNRALVDAAKAGMGLWAFGSGLSGSSTFRRPRAQSRKPEAVQAAQTFTTPGWTGHPRFYRFLNSTGTPPWMLVTPRQRSRILNDRSTIRPARRLR